MVRDRETSNRARSHVCVDRREHARGWRSSTVLTPRQAWQRLTGSVAGRRASRSSRRERIRDPPSSIFKRRDRTVIEQAPDVPAAGARLDREHAHAMFASPAGGHSLPRLGDQTLEAVVTIVRQSDPTDLIQIGVWIPHEQLDDIR